MLLLLPLVLSSALDSREVVSWQRFDGLNAVAALANLTVGTAVLAKGESTIGLSAQEVQRVLPLAVRKESNGSLTLRYDNVFTLGLRVTQQLVAQAANAESRVVALKEQNQRLEKRLEELERRLMLIGEMLDYRESVRQDDEPTVMRG